jgi:formylglycine-generating enzyme required for sulfatase activity
MSVLDVLDIPKEDLPWFRSELFRRAAMCFEIAAQEEDRSAAEQRGFWYDAAECWADAGDTARAAVIYRRLDDHAQAAPLLLINGQWSEALACYRAWLAELDDRDEGHPVGRARALLGVAACLRGEAGEARQRGDRATRERKRHESRAAYQQARNLIEKDGERELLAAGRCWEALGWYGQVMGRHDLIQVGYEMALRRYGERYNRERVRTARAYLDAVGETNRLLAAELEARLAEWAPPEQEGELKGWEKLRNEIEEIGFQDGVRDVLHFVDEETQLEAWWELAEITDDPDQAAIDDYLRGLAPEGMVYVPAGPFLMGTTEEEVEALVAEFGQDHRNEFEREVPQHEVDLPGYYIGRYPVTNEAYAEFIAAGGYETREYWAEAIEAGRWEDGQYNDYWSGLRAQPEYWDDENCNQPRQPVVGVSWYEAVAYCRWRGLRLPTEAEWEKAAAAEPLLGSSSRRSELLAHRRKYPWGDEWDEGKYVWNPSSWPEVGSISPGDENGYGVHDMAGLYTWCSTRWRDEEGNDYTYPYKPGDGREDLSGGNDVWRVVRGGGSDQRRARCAYRNWYVPGNRYFNNGLRVSAPRRLLPSGSES